MTTDSSTHPSLLIRVRNAGDDAAWREFDTRYGDLIVRYCLSRGLQFSDAEDVRQMVMFGLSKSLRQLRYSPQKGRFRNYLGKVVRRVLAHFFSDRRPDFSHLPQDIFESSEAVAATDHRDERDPLWDQEWVRHHYRLAMRTIRATFEPRSVEAFDRLLAGEPVIEVSKAFGMSEQAVHKIKQRIRDRVRDLIAQQIRDEEGGDGHSK